MNQEKQYIEFWKFIGILHQADLLRHLILIGSWAEYIYAQSGILPGYDANLRTLDVDFLIQNRNQPRQEKSIVSLAKDNGYTVAYDVMYGTTKIFTSDFMEIEFIIEKKGRGNLPVLNTNLGVRAQALRNMALLKRVAIEISIFGYDIIVPKPEAYVLHKIIIN